MDILGTYFKMAGLGLAGGGGVLESLSVRVRNPFALRESLQIALEVAWPDLPPGAVCVIKSFLEKIPTRIQPIALPIDGGARQTILACSAHFRQSRTAHWLREDFVQALRDLERELQG